jgi:hypothetical protein
LKHLLLEGDTDLLPPLPEVDALKFSWTAIRPLFANLDIEQYRWKGERRFVIPKESLALRSATQLDPIDSLVFAAIIRKWGSHIERIRIPVNEQRVFSHRFSPTPDGRFYGDASGWHEFWERSVELASRDGVTHVLMADVVDYYNQVFHHVLENQLDDAGLPKPIWLAIKRLVTHLTQSVSRGLPVGPHPAHLLAEVALNPIDRSIIAHGMDFCRFVDDIHIFCQSEQEAVIAAQELAGILDDQQRLALHKQKTRTMERDDFITLAQSMLNDRPLDDLEEDIMRVIAVYSGDSPYETIDFLTVTEEDLNVVRAERLEPLLGKYLSAEEVEYGHVRWLLRRLSQMGAPGAINFVLQHLDDLGPALGDVARYVMRASPNYHGDWLEGGDRIIGALNHPLIRRNEYIRLVLLHLFARVPELNHLAKLTASYGAAPGAVRREIVFAARAGHDGAWLRARKSEFEAADPWLRRAIVAAASAWPGDEGHHWIQKVKQQLTFAEKVMARWAFRDRKLNVGVFAVA